jgi:hypothetical protein
VDRRYSKRDGSPAPTRRISGDSVGLPSWASYGWYRARVLAEAAELGTRPAEIERALLIHTKDVPSVTGRPWADYAHALHAARQQLRPAAT